MENIHSGHRARMKERFANHGLEAMSDVEALEMLLYFALPRRDTNILAHRLLERFGSFRAVMEADESELCQVPGVGEHAAMLLRFTRELGRRYLLSRRKGKRVLLRSTQESGDYVLPLFAYTTEEAVYAISLGSGRNVIRCHRMASGMANAVEFGARELLEIALQDKASFILLAHNHLSDTALPSNADIIATNFMQDALHYVGVRLADHIIVCDGDYVSLLDSGYFNAEE